MIAVSVCYTSARPTVVPGIVGEWIARAAEVDAIEFVVTIDADRPADLEALASLPRTRVFLNRGRPCCVDGWNLAARKARGSILIQCSDDLHPPHGWDAQVRDRLADGARAAVLATSDGLTAGLQFIPHAIVSRRYYSEFGYLFHDAYWSMWSDNELSAVAHRRSAVIDALQIRFSHDNGRFNDDVRTRHEAPAFYGGGYLTFHFREQHGFEPWKFNAFNAEDGDSDGIYSPNWCARLPTYWGKVGRGEGDYLALHADSLARRTNLFGAQPPVEALQVLIATEPRRRAFVDLLTAELARQKIPFLLDERAGISRAQKQEELLERATAEYVTFIDDGDWVSHNYGELIGDAIATNEGPDLVLHDALSARGGESPKPSFFSLDRAGEELADCRLRSPDRSMVWRRVVARRNVFAPTDVTRWARVRGLLRFEECAAD